MRRILAVVAAAALGLAACAPASRDSGGDRLVVVATTSVLADLVAQVGRERVDVRALVPAGGEPHTFDPSPSDVTRLQDAVLVVQNGLGLDDWLADLVADAGTEAPIIVLGEDLEGVEYRSAGAHEAHEETEGEPEESGHGAGEALDPHLWLNVAYAALYVERIADALAAADPPGADAYAANSDAYRAELGELDGYARETLGAIPAERRKVVSFHEAFGYFADAYGLTIVDTVVDAPGQDPSVGAVAALIDEIERSGAAAILAEAQFPTDLVDRIAEETGATVVADLYSDSLGPPPADTLVGMLRADVDAIAAALR